MSKREYCVFADEDGRIIPLYVVYILLTLAVARETREFWHFRRGGKVNG